MNRAAPDVYRFQACIHARHPQAAAGAPIELRGRALATLETSPDLSPVPLGASFEVAAAMLSRLPRMFLEGDGAFVWRSPGDEPSWQLDGVLYDMAGRLLYVELKGSCPAAEFDQLLTALGHPATELKFQLVAEGVYLDEAMFRQYAVR